MFEYNYALSNYRDIVTIVLCFDWFSPSVSDSPSPFSAFLDYDSLVFKFFVFHVGYVLCSRVFCSWNIKLYFGLYPRGRALIWYP